MMLSRESGKGCDCVSGQPDAGAGSWTASYRALPHLLFALGGLRTATSRSRPGGGHRRVTSNSFINAYMQIPDRRAEAHAALQPLPTVPLPAVVLIEGLLELVDQNGEQIGMLDLFTESSTQVTGAGEIYPMSALAGQTFLPVDVYTRPYRR